jgi:hypothetical protein
MTNSKNDPATGPIKFATVVLSLAGILNIIDGIAAVANDDRFNTARLLIDNLTAWGIVYIVIGAVQIWAASALWARKTYGLVLAISLASLSGIVHFMTIGAYPIWSITVMVLDFAVIFALLTNDDAF